MNELRYWLDVRIGCCAVRDRQRPRDDRNGLDCDMTDVVRFWPGKLIETVCSACGSKSSHWGLPEETVAEAQALCDKLNAEARDAPPQ